MADNKSNDSYIWISYSDLMTTVTFAFIFILMGYISSDLALKKQLEELKKDGQTSQQKLQALVQAKNSLGTILADIKQKIENTEACEDVIWSVENDNTSLRATFKGEQGWFKDGDSQLSSNAQKCLSLFAVVWLEMLYQDETVRDNLQNLIIEGHTNSRPIKPKGNAYLDNLELSQKRAYSAATFILEKITRNQFSLGNDEEEWLNFENWRRKALSATGRSYSERLYITPEKNAEDFERSKRIEFSCLIRQDFTALKDVLKATR